jgi:hypothetical protein
LRINSIFEEHLAFILRKTKKARVIMYDKEIQASLKRAMEQLQQAVTGGEFPEALPHAREVLRLLLIQNFEMEARQTMVQVVESAAREVMERGAPRKESVREQPPAPSAPPVAVPEPVTELPVMTPEIRVVPVPEGPPKRIIADVVSGQRRPSVADRLAAEVPKNLSLNERMLLTKALFRGQSEDFDKVYRMALDQGSADQACTFLIEVVGPDYGWKADAPPVEQLLAHIRRVMTS